MFKTLRFAVRVFKSALWFATVSNDPQFGSAFASGELPWKPGDGVFQLCAQRDSLRYAMDVYGDECDSAVRDAAERAVEHMSAAVVALREMYEADGLPIGAVS